jgi:predicted AAA+ superfamily ATPase
MIKRALSERIYEDLTTANKMVFISGPRQVGKTTLARTIGSDKFSGRYSYLNWDSREDRASILRGEFRADNVLVIFDEIHKYRQWKNYLKGEYDKYKERFKILVTGSARMDIYRKGGDSLQGRYYNYLLHPLSINEVIGNRAKTTPFHEPDFKPSSKEAAEAFDALFRFGGFPEMFVKQSDRELRRWHNDRVDRLVKEDIRDVESLRDLSAIEVMVEMLPERAGSVFSLNSLCEDLRATHRTVSLWADVLEKFYYHFRIYPFRYSTIKSLRKEPKLYLWDWSQVKGEGARFENMIASHLLKFCDYLRNSEGHKAALHYLRDVEKREVDFLVAVDGKPWLCAEAKLSKDAVAPALKYFSTKMKIPFVYQVLKEEGVDTVRDNIRTISASRFLTGFY